MKKIIALISAVLCLQMTAFADVQNVSYTDDEEYKQTTSSGYEYLSYSGELRFSVDDSDIDDAGCILYYFNDDDKEYLPIDIPFSGDLSSGNFSMRFGGLGFGAGEYKIIPYYIKNGEKKLGEEKSFTVTENCMALANLRVAYDQIQKIEFNEKERQILSYVLPAVEETIAAGESGEVEITKNYIAKTYPEQIKTARELYENKKFISFSERMEFLGKLQNGIDENARSYIITTFL